MKAALWLIIVILAALPALAVEQELFKGTAKPNVAFEAGGIVFTVTPYGAPPTKAVIKYLNATIIIDVGDCRKEGGIRICVNSYAEGDIDPEQHKQLYNMEVAIYQNVADLDITRTISEEDLDIGDQATISLTLDNKQDLDVTAITYKDAFPGEISLVSTDGRCTKAGNTVIWDGALASGKSHKCSYIIKVTAPVDFTSKASVSFFNGVTTISKESSSISFDVENKMFDIKISSDKDKVDLNEEAAVWINVTNIRGESIPGVNIHVSTPPLFVINKMDAALNKDLTWSGTIGINNTRSIKLTLKGSKIGSDKIVLDVNTTINGVPLAFQQTLPLSVKKPELMVFRNMSAYKFPGGEKAVWIFNVTNPNKLALKDIQLTMTSNLPGLEKDMYSWPSLDKNQSIQFFKRELDMPAVKETLDVEVHFTFTYKIYDGTSLAYDYTEYLFVIPGKEAPAEKKNDTQQQVLSDEFEEEPEEGPETAPEPSSPRNESLQVIEITEKQQSILPFAIIGAAVVICIVALIFLQRKFSQRAEPKEPNQKA